MQINLKQCSFLLLYAGLAIVTLAVYWPVHNHQFVDYDDDVYVTDNPNIQSGLNWQSVKWALTTSYFSYWHPLTWLSHTLDWQLFGGNPGPQHLVNVFLHTANSLLLFIVLNRMTKRMWPSVFIAGLFALHPLNVESVAWIAERKNILSTLFWLLTMLAYVRYTECPSPGRYVITLIFFEMGLMSKPMLVTLPFVLLLLDYWPLGRFSISWRLIRNLILEKMPFVLLAGVSCVITFINQQKGGAMAMVAIPFKERMANAAISYLTYICKMFWPQNLAVFYPFDLYRFAFWQVGMCVLLLLVISIFVIRFGRNRRYLPVGWFWFVVTLIPVIGLVQSGAQSHADRYTYIPYIGLFIVIAWGLPELLSKWPQRKIALGLSMVMVLTTLGICTHKQVSYWNNSFTLFSHALEVTQNNYIAYNNLGFAYDSVGRYQDAIEAYKQAIRIKPDFAEANNNLGVTYYKLGRSQDALEAYKQTIKIKPDYAKAYYNLGISYKDLGRYEDAVGAYKQAIRIQPDFAGAYIDLGVTCYKLGHSQDAIEAYKQAIKIKPDFAGAHYNLGLTYLLAGDKGLALEEYKILKTLDAEQANKLFNLIYK